MNDKNVIKAAINDIPRAYLGGYWGSISPQKVWLAIGVTLDHQEQPPWNLYKCIKQQTILCLAEQIYAELMGIGKGVGNWKLLYNRRLSIEK